MCVGSMMYYKSMDWQKIALQYGSWDALEFDGLHRLFFPAYTFCELSPRKQPLVTLYNMDHGTR
ncbi:hypothetical protein J6590_057226 [Homalodisca vitripennis]|nr:hypothetical protein J6590_094553 [Homalodisca vitripennis]KAG8241092.1 hypothetical protein J6590_094556 [Homalodisca vitripennis]KAG8242866.1 hypothetical protein J6590_057223 [Homalodisca vitripennis]KAG8242869.1 hypothetical protein J6590_057226 [Homalodisca vitripennis]